MDDNEAKLAVAIGKLETKMDQMEKTMKSGFDKVDELYADYLTNKSYRVSFVEMNTKLSNLDDKIDKRLDELKERLEEDEKLLLKPEEKERLNFLHGIFKYKKTVIMFGLWFALSPIIAILLPIIIEKLYG